MPVPVAGACAFLGLDPVKIASEGKLVAVVPPDAADDVFDAMAPFEVVRTPPAADHTGFDDERHLPVVHQVGAVGPLTPLSADQ